jgi:TonB-linked SusC/RagA family outer membrane protein
MKEQYKFLFVMLFFAFAAIPALAQEKTVTGTIRDDQGTPIPGVNVVVKGTSTGTASDSDGKFSLNVGEGQNILVVSFIGFTSQEIDITNKTSVDVSMVSDIKELSEVVVTALGVERNTKALQSSITQVSGDNLTLAREVNLGSSLAGRVAGVNVTKTGAGASGSSRVIIRGNKSMSAYSQNQPLYVIDGIPMDNSGFGQAGVWGGTDQGDGLSSLNPDDIESISVLKGASAAALYGSRGGNGVILVTTKKGRAQKGVGIELNSNYVFENVINQSELQQEFGSGGFANVDPNDPDSPRVGSKPTTRTQAFNNGDQSWGARLDGSDVIQYDGVMRPYSYAGDNWERYYETGSTFTNTLSLNGGSDKQTFRFSFSDLKNEGVIPNSGYDRRNVSLTTNGKYGNKLSFNAKVLYTNEKTKNRSFLADSPGNPIQAVWRLSPNYNVENLIGDPNKPGAVPAGFETEDSKGAGEELQTSPNLWGQNPYWAAYQYKNNDTRDRIIGSAQMRFDFTDYLYIQGRIGMDWFTRRSTSLTPQGTGYQRGGSAAERQNNVREINQEWILGFDKEFGKINVNAFFGGNKMVRVSENVGAAGNTFNIPFFPAVGNTSSQNFEYDHSESGINSLFGSAEISYNNYLFLTATGRQDWFSVLNPENNTQFYPSIGTSFVFSDAVELPSLFSFGKLRASWAQVAVANVDPYAVNNAYALNGQGHLGLPMATFSNGDVIPNPGISPALSTEFEVGFDVRFLQNRLGIDFTYYDQKTTDDILRGAISQGSGFNETLLNVGELSNKGIELLLTGTPVKGPLTWDISLNLARNDNKIVTINGDQKNLLVEEPRTRTVFIEHIRGESFGMITGYIQQKSPSGEPVFNAETGAPVRTAGYEIIGNGIAKLTGGLTNTLTYKNVSFSALIDFKFGGDLYSGTNVRLTQWGLHEQTLAGRPGHEAITVNGVAQSGTDGDGNPVYEPFTKTLNEDESRNYWQDVGENQQDRFVYDASFIKLRQLTLGYNFPLSIIGNSPVKTLSLSFVARNLAVLMKNVDNVDPESNYSNTGGTQGLDYFGMPQTRSYGFNLRATF